MGSSLFAALLLLTLTVVSAKYSEFDANGSEARDIARKLLKQFANEQDILVARKQHVYAPKDSYNLGRIYELHLAVGVQKCASPVNQVLLADGTLLSVVNQPTEYLFEHLDSFL